MSSPSETVSTGQPEDGKAGSPESSFSLSISKLADEYLLILIVVMMMVRPFISGRTFQWSNTWFQMAWFACGGIWIARCAGKGSLPIKNRLSVGLLAGFVLVCAVTLATGISANDTYRGLCEVSSYLVAMYLAMHVTRDWRSARGVVIAIVVVSVLISLDGYFQRVYILEFARHQYLEKEELFQKTLVGSMNAKFWERMQVNRVFATFLHPPSFAGYLILCIPLTLGLMAAYKRLRHLVACGAAFSMQLTALLLTYTRGAWLALAMSGGVMAFFAWYHRSSLRGRIVPLALALFISTCVAVGLTLSPELVSGALRHAVPPADEVAEPEPAPTPEPRPEPQQPDLSGVDLDVNALMDPGSFGARLTYWHGAARMFAANPVLGIGWNSFGVAYPRYMSLGGYPSQLAHNDYLQVLAETGIIGFMFYAGFWIVVVGIGAKLCFDRDIGPELSWLRVGIVCGLLSFLFHSLVDFDLYIPGIALNVFFLTGLLIGTHPAEPRQYSIGRVKAAVAVSALAFAVGFSFSPYWADHIFGNKVSLETQLGVADAMLQGRPVKAQDAAMLLSRDEIELIRSGRISRDKQFAIILARMEAIKERIAIAETFYRFDSLFPGFQGTIDHIAAHAMINPIKYADSAIRNYQRAAELSPMDATIHVLLARAYIQRGNYAESEDERRSYYTRALQQFESAVNCYPNNPDIWKERGDLYIGLGQEEKGNEYLKRAEQLRPHFNT